MKAPACSSLLASSLALTLLLTAQAAGQPCALLKDINTGNSGKDSSTPMDLTSCWGNTLFFSAVTKAAGRELYKWDAASGVTLLKDINPGAASGGLGTLGPTGFTCCCTKTGPLVFFTANNGKNGIELWKSNGTAAGTMMVKDILPGPRASFPAELTCCEGRVFFVADDGTNGRELWASDGTTAGTVLVKNIGPGRQAGFPGWLACCNGKVYFSAYQIATGRELWVSDGTALGTKLVKDIVVGTKSSSITELICCGGKLFFHGNGGPKGFELFVSDGTAAGTKVLDVNPNAGHSSPTQLTCCSGKLFFAAVGRFGGKELFVSDGTASGTKLVKDVRPGGQSSFLGNLTCADGKLFFSALGAGLELWVSDGTTAGTKLVKDINPGSGSSFPQLMKGAGSGVFFNARDGSSGQELWFSDGTTAGTKRVCDINPGSASSQPQWLECCWGHLFFAATSPTKGREIFWVQKPGGTHRLLGEGGRPGRPTLVIKDGKNPVIGAMINLVASGPASYTGFLVVGLPLPPLPPIPGLMDGGCDWVGVFTPFSIIALVTAQPSFTLPVTVPPAEGAKLNLQVWWYKPAGTPTLQASNGLHVVIGKGGPQ